MASAVIKFIEDGENVVLETEFDPPLTAAQVRQLADTGETEGIPETHVAAIIAVTQTGDEYNAGPEDYTLQPVEPDVPSN